MPRMQMSWWAVADLLLNQRWILDIFSLNLDSTVSLALITWCCVFRFSNKPFSFFPELYVCSKLLMYQYFQPFHKKCCPVVGLFAWSRNCERVEFEGNLMTLRLAWVDGLICRDKLSSSHKTPQSWDLRTFTNTKSPKTYDLCNSWNNWKKNINMIKMVFLEKDQSVDNLFLCW